MLRTLNTLFKGAAARNEEAVRDVFALELIDQKIRESEQHLRASKGHLASLIQRERSERRQLQQLEIRHADMSERAKEALQGDRIDLAEQASEALAQMENEAEVRRKTVTKLEGHVMKLRQAVEAAHRRIVDLKQGATMARALKREQAMQVKLGGTIVQASAVDEAEALVARVLNREDPTEQQDILKEINADLTHEALPDRMAAAGFGKATKASGADVLARLQAEAKTEN